MNLLDIVFSKLRQKQILVDDRKYNIYRLVNCMTKYNNKRSPYCYALFSFFFQISAACYLVLSLTPLDADPFIEPRVIITNIPLAICTAGFGLMVAFPEMKSAGHLYRVHYGQFSMLACMDFIVNFILPVIVAVAGFFVVSVLGVPEGVRQTHRILIILDSCDALGTSRFDLSGRCLECGRSYFHH